MNVNKKDLYDKLVAAAGLSSVVVEEACLPENGLYFVPLLEQEKFLIVYRGNRNGVYLWSCTEKINGFTLFSSGFPIHICEDLAETLNNVFINNPGIVKEPYYETE